MRTLYSDYIIKHNITQRILVFIFFFVFLFFTKLRNLFLKIFQSYHSKYQSQNSNLCPQMASRLMYVPPLTPPSSDPGSPSNSLQVILIHFIDSIRKWTLSLLKNTTEKSKASSHMIFNTHFKQRIRKH